MVAMNKRFECDIDSDDLVYELQDRIEELEIDQEFTAWQHRLDMWFIAAFCLCVGCCVGMSIMKPNEHKRAEQAAIVGSPR